LTIDPESGAYVPLTNSGTYYTYNNFSGNVGWDIISSEQPRVDVDTVSYFYLYNKDTDVIIRHLDYIDPAKGKILGSAQQDLDYITAYDFIEHIPRILYNPSRSFPFINLMNEIFRCLKPGGYFFSHTPAYPYSPLFRDPTHVNYITEETFSIYFDNVSNYAKIYGFTGGFEIVEQGWNGYTLITLMRKPAL
jgi:SAM-dependent methyltransferase